MSVRGSNVDLSGNGINKEDYKYTLTELCRCCMSLTPKPLQFGFDSFYSEIYTKFISIEFQSEEPNLLPKFICKTCTLQLNNMKIFIQKCVQTEQKLREITLERINHELYSKVDLNEVKCEDNHEDDNTAWNFDDNDIGSSDDDWWLGTESEEPKKTKKTNIKRDTSKEVKPCAECGFQCESHQIMKKHYKENEKCKLRYACNICGHKSKTGSGLKSHMNTHNTKSEEFKCNICLKCFKTKTFFKKHLNKRHGETDQTIQDLKDQKKENSEVENCVKEEPHLKDDTIDDTSLKQDVPVNNLNSTNSPTKNIPLDQNNLKEEETIRLHCYTCGKKMNNKYLLKTHYEENEGCNPKTFKCKICDHVAKCRSYLKIHMLVHDSKKGAFKCDVCAKGYKHERSLIQHQEQHGKTVKRHKCCVCSEDFKRVQDLTQHMIEIHPNEKPYLCETCGKTFHLHRHLREHTLKFHATTEKSTTSITTTPLETPLECKKCSIKFLTRSKYFSHMTNKHKEKSHLCTFCGKAFISKSALKSHGLVHTGEKPFACHLCPKKYSAKIQLNYHINMHTGARPYECEFCKRTFRTASHLHLHKRTHTGVRPFKCDICGEAFAISGTLVVHRRRHTGERPYQCPFCPSAFTNSTSRKQHVKTVHKEFYDPKSTQY